MVTPRTPFGLVGQRQRSRSVLPSRPSVASGCGDLSAYRAWTSATGHVVRERRNWSGADPAQSSRDTSPPQERSSPSAGGSRDTSPLRVKEGAYLVGAGKRYTRLGTTVIARPASPS